MNNVFFQEFLMLSDIRTLIFIAILIALFGIMYKLQSKRVSFSKRMIVGTVLGLVLGLIIQAVSGFDSNPMSHRFVAETTKWYSLFGRGFVDLIKMLVVPLVMVTIIHVIIHMNDKSNIGQLTKYTILVTMSMVFIAASVGLIVGVVFNLGSTLNTGEQAANIRDVKSIVDTIRGILPSNPAKAMVEVNVIALVILSIFFGLGAKRMSKKYYDVIKPFNDLIDALQKIIMSVAMSVIKLMPYAVIALLANTIAQRGLKSIVEVGVFIVALYVGVIIMFIVQLLALSVYKINPFTYVKKAIGVMLLAFTSRSSVGTLPLTIETLTDKLGADEGSASFVASFGTTAGMQGCAGVFPALLLVFVANMNGIPIDFTFIVMALVVIVLGSLGIAGIPGTATMAASVSLSGMGLATYFPMISPILAIDPIIDMGRTFLNVSGAMVNTLIVDKKLNQLDIEKFNSADA